MLHDVKNYFLKIYAELMKTFTLNLILLFQSERNFKEAE